MDCLFSQHFSKAGFPRSALPILLNMMNPVFLRLWEIITLNPGWDMGARILYSTGHPYTAVLSSSTTIINNVTINEPNYGTINSSVFRIRCLGYFSTSFKTVYDTWEWKIYLDIVNLLHDQNVLGYQYNSTYTQKTPEYDLPFLPYLGLEVKY